ncbi:unnamed protein product [Prorocentrum cordatum]|uniref:Uncharacterized protein n=1 Tax=Prorocentrum cordatum TaxID=2364126 RepID=A0ABN9PQJ2_9DINO|nr:unnamed protein product [Polarella glacialis]
MIAARRIHLTAAEDMSQHVSGRLGEETPAEMGLGRGVPATQACGGLTARCMPKGTSKRTPRSNHMFSPLVRLYPTLRPAAVVHFCSWAPGFALRRLGCGPEV